MCLYGPVRGTSHGTLRLSGINGTNSGAVRSRLLSGLKSEDEGGDDHRSGEAGDGKEHEQRPINTTAANRSLSECRW